MALLSTQFYTQISLATIKKTAKCIEMNTELEFWESDIIFNLNKSDFSFKIIPPSKNSIKKRQTGDDRFQLEFAKPVQGDRNGIKRFWTKEEADSFILLNIIQVYKPLKNYVEENNLEIDFNNLIDMYPEKVLRELKSGKSWLTN